MTDPGGKVAMVIGSSDAQRVAFRLASQGAALMLVARAEMTSTAIADSIVVALPLTEVA